MRAVDPDALAWAWQAATADSPLHGSHLHLDMLPWQLHCPSCNRRGPRRTSPTPAPAASTPPPSAATNWN